MIWFTCKQCGKTHSRTDASAGATIFCQCGAGVLVPWESTTAEPPEALAEPMLPELKLEPVTFATALDTTAPAPTAPPPPGRKRKPGRLGQRDPQFCFNHQDTPKKAVCADCSEAFCEHCLVSFQDTELCGPCKNYRVRNMQSQTPPSNLAMLSMLSAFLICPFALGLVLANAPVAWGWSLLALACQVLVGWLGLLALREAEKDIRATGRALALTGLIQRHPHCGPHPVADDLCAPGLDLMCFCRSERKIRENA